MKQELQRTKTKLSTLWILAMLNFIYADVIGFFAPGMIDAIKSGYAGGLQINHTLLFGSAVLMEIPILMVLLSLCLPYRANRWANVVTGFIYTGVTLVTLTAFGTPAPYYLFFGIAEVAITALIVWYAWRWPKPEALHRDPVAAGIRVG